MWTWGWGMGTTVQVQVQLRPSIHLFCGLEWTELDWNELVELFGSPLWVRMCAGQYFIKPDISSCSSDYGPGCDEVAILCEHSGIDCHCPCVFIPLLMFMLTLTYLASYRFAISVRHSIAQALHQWAGISWTSVLFSTALSPQSILLVWVEVPMVEDAGDNCSSVRALWTRMKWTMTCRNERVWPLAVSYSANEIRDTWYLIH